MSKVQSSDIIIQKALYLKSLGEEFTLTKINNSFKLESEYYGRLSSSSNRKIPPIELGFIRRVRNHVINNQIYEQFISKLYYPKDINYVAIKKRESGYEVDDVVEIDIDEAYYKTAFNLGVIDTKLYLEGSKENGKISKKGRLIALGSLARKEEHYHFVGDRLRRETTRSVLTENVWYSICKRVSDLMHQAKVIAGDDFIIYWVDGIYIKNNPAKIEKIIKLFNESKYDAKIRSNLSVKFTDDKVLIKDKSSNKERPFFIPKSTTKKSYFTDQKLREIALEFSKYGVLDDINESNEQ